MLALEFFEVWLWPLYTDADAPDANERLPLLAEALRLWLLLPLMLLSMGGSSEARAY